jgi:Flp pilus assembly protein TadD
VALKFLPEEVAGDPGRLMRFKSEAQTLATLNHPNIVTIHSVEDDGERSFLVMELVEGETLVELLKANPIKLERFFDLAIPLADALAAAHEQGVIHRDLKPSNVMVTRDGKPKILDFGLAKLSLPDDGTVASGLTTELLTREGRVVGTPAFMSPEQLEGRPIDHRSDIFSLGILLYRLATGTPPFEGTTEAEIVSSILRDTPDSADVVRPGLPHHLGRLLRLCLEKNVDHRLQSAHDLRNEFLELRRELTSGEVSVPAAVAVAPGPKRWRSWLVAAVAAAAIVALMAVGIGRFSEPTLPELELSADVQVLLDQGHMREMRGDTLEDLAAAEDRYRRALELEPDHPLIQARLALVLARAQIQYPEPKRGEELRQLAAQALAAGPGLALTHHAHGVVRLADRDATGAEAAARRAIELDAGDWGGHTLLGRALIRQDKVEAGLKALRQAVQIAGPDVRARLALAVALNGLGLTNEAVTEYERILDYAPDYPSALNNLGMIYAQTGRELDAIPLLKRALQIRRDEAAAVNLGMIYMHQDRLEDAIRSFEAAYEIDPGKPVIAHSLGEAYEKLGDLAGAREWFEAAFETYSRDLAAGGDRAKDLALRAVCAAKLGRFEQAREDIGQALALDPHKKYRLFNAAQVYALAGERDEAFSYARLAVEGGYSRSDFLNDLAFAAYRDEPEFLALIESEAAR